MSNLIERIDNLLKRYEEDVVEFPRDVLIDAADALEVQDKEIERLTMMLTEYVRLDNAGKIPMEPVGGAVDKENV